MHRLGSLLGVLVGFAITAVVGMQMWAIGIRMGFYQVSFDGDGARFRLGSKKNPEVLLFPWDRITGVLYKRAVNTQYGSVVALDGSSVQFSSYTFFRPKKLLRLIAERSGQSIQQMK